MKRRTYNSEVIAKRITEWQALSPAEQLKQLDARLGKGVGAKRQRAKLLKRCAQ